MTSTANKTAASNKTSTANQTANANITVAVNQTLTANKTALHQKYSLVDQFVKQYADAAPAAPVEATKNHTLTQKKEHKKHHKHEHKEHKHHHHHHHDKKEEKPDDKRNVQLRDWDDDEDKQILDSIKYAENKLGAKMGTPKVMPKEHAYAPVKYDVEDGGATSLSLSTKDKKNLGIAPEDD